MYNLSDRYLWLVYVLSFCLIMSLSSTCPAENLLVNSDFGQGKPDSRDFGWKIELAEGQKNKCALAQGRSPGSKAVSFYNDERSSSCISQEFTV